MASGSSFLRWKATRMIFLMGEDSVGKTSFS